MASRLGFCRVTPVVAYGFQSCKSTVSYAFPASRLDSKFDELAGSKKRTPAPSNASILAPNHTSTPAPIHMSTFAPILAEFNSAFKYNEADLMKILKIFLKTKGQKPRPEVPCKQSLKAKVLEIYLEKTHINCYHFCQQSKDYFKIAGAT